MESIKPGQLVADTSLYEKLKTACQSAEIHAIYAPEGQGDYPDCYLAAIDLFGPGQTYKVYFTFDENGSPYVESIQRWWFG